MQIKRLKITGLYGHINKDISFNPDLTILVGINGSGKTSILNIINWIIKPSFPQLCITDFKSIELYFKFNNKHYKVSCKHLKARFIYQISSEKEIYPPLTVELSITPKDINNDEALKTRLLQSYRSLEPVDKEKETWDLISSFPDPTVIGLDRNIFTEEADMIYLEDRIRDKTLKKAHLSPLDRVKEIVNKEYRKKKNAILTLTSELKNHLMLSTFDGSITVESFDIGIKSNLKLHQIQAAEKRVNDYFNNFENKIFTPTHQETIRKYFRELQDITNRYHNEPENATVKLLYGLNVNQFVKVKALLKEFEKFESESSKALQQIDNYLNTLNHFFNDSAKQLVFKEDTSELTFNIINKDGEILSKNRDIRFLSSGEQQLLILFSYIAFNSEDGKVFIIDEPELSLHIKWQEDFLNYLEKITPTNTQLILATHSPILAGKKREKTELLLPYN